MTDEVTAENKRSWPSRVKDHWAWVTPLIYIYVCYIGMVVSWYRFKKFGINIFEYSEINDFLLAAFRHPMSIVWLAFLLFLFILFTLLYWTIIRIIFYWTYNVILFLGSRRTITPNNTTIEQKKLSFANLFNRLPILVVFILYLLGVPILAGYSSIYDLGLGKFECEIDRRVEVTFSDRGNVELKQKKYAFLGTTDNFVFFYDYDKKKAAVAPFVNVLLIEQTDSTVKLDQCPQKN